MNATTLHKTLVFLYAAVNLQEKGKPKYFVEVLHEVLKNPPFIVFIYVFFHRHMEIRHCPFQVIFPSLPTGTSSVFSHFSRDRVSPGVL